MAEWITHFSILNSHDSVEIVSACDSSTTLMNILGKYVDIKPDFFQQEDLDLAQWILECQDAYGKPPQRKSES